LLAAGGSATDAAQL
jgi:hypothetical protein